MNLGPGKEFDRIRAIFNRISELSPEAEGLGDDCALVPLGTTTLAVSIDASLEGVHFRTDWLDFKEIGFRAAGAAERRARGRWTVGHRISRWCGARAAGFPGGQADAGATAESLCPPGTSDRRWVLVGGSWRHRDDRYFRR